MRSTLPLAALVFLVACGSTAAPPIVPPPAPQLPPPGTASAAEDDAPDEAATAAAAKPTLAELQLAAAKSLTDAVAARDAKKIGDVYAADGVITIYGDRTLTGRDAITAEYQRWLDGMSDLKFQVGRVFQNGNVVVAEWAFTGTHSGEFLGAKATQSPVGTAGVSVIWFDTDGRIAKEHRVFDVGTIRKQDDRHAKVGTFRSPPPLAVSVEGHLAKSPADAEAQIAIVRALYAAMDADKESDALALDSDDVAIDDFAQPRPLKGAKAARTLFGDYEAEVPKGASTSTMFAADDFVVSDREVHATSKHVPVTLHFVEIFEVHDAKITRMWTWSNSEEIAVQVAAASKKSK